jgi:hypothetical protein
LANVFSLYRNHVRLVLLNACFTKAQARSISEVVNYSIGTGRGIGDKVGVAFAGAFYRALGFGRSVRDAFESAQAELALTKIPRSRGIELFVRDGLSDEDPFPSIDKLQSRYSPPFDSHAMFRTEASYAFQITVTKTARQTSLVQI